MIEPADEHAAPLERPIPLPAKAVGVIMAFVRVAELYDPAVAHRSALRAIVADRLAHSMSTTQPLSSNRSVVIATAAVMDLDTAIQRTGSTLSPGNPSDSLLGSTLIEGVAGLRDVALALRHRSEHFDGTGTPEGLHSTEIPFASRVCAVANHLVGNPTAGFIPSWDDARERTLRAEAARFDPAILSALHHLDFDEIGVEHNSGPLSASRTIQGLFDSVSADNHEPQQHHNRSHLDPALSTNAICNAVSNAAKPAEVAELLLRRARASVDATEIVVFTSTSTQLNPTPLVRLYEGPQPELSLTRLDDIFEFSTQAELRAGITLERSLPRTGRETGTQLSSQPDRHDEIITPIMINGEIWGLLVASRSPGSIPFSPDERDELTSVAHQMADIVLATDHWADMEKMALGDQLTGIGNRHHLYRVLDAIFERPLATRLDTALIMCDVDGLKVVNDTLGHHEGDRLLIDAAAALKGAVRDPDTTTVCRIGGDEFCMVIDGGALLTAHEITQTIERLFERSAGSGPSRSISCGIAFADASVQSRSELLRTADENQYQTKRARKQSQRDQRATATHGQPADRRALRD